MTVDEFLAASEEFFRSCQEEMERKSPDYSTNNEMLGDIYAIAKDLNQRPSYIAYVQARKHLQAINTWITHTHLNSEGICHRLRDAANYMAILDIIIRRERVGASLSPQPKPIPPDDVVVGEGIKPIPVKAEFPKHIPHPFQGKNTLCSVCNLALAAKVHHVMERPPSFERD